MAETRQQPESLADLYVSFTILALQGFGGVLVVVQRELVERKRWLTNEEFLEEWAVAQVMPGPNVVNLALTLGARHFGLAGALAAVAGVISVPLLLVLALALAYAGFVDDPRVVGALRGMSAAAAGLVVATGLKLAGALRSNVLGAPLCTIACLLVFAAVVLLRVPLAWILLVVGGACVTLAYRRLA